MLLVFVYRNGHSDCSLNGVSARHDSLWMISESEVATCTEDKDRVVVKIDRMLWGELHPVLVPLEVYDAYKKSSLPIMFGGNFCYTSDSRFGSNPIPIHDRVETWEMYEEMSR